MHVRKCGGVYRSEANFCAAVLTFLLVEEGLLLFLRLCCVIQISCPGNTWAVLSLPPGSPEKAWDCRGALLQGWNLDAELAHFPWVPIALSLIT